MLLLASLACVLALTVGLSGTQGIAGLTLKRLLLTAVFAGAGSVALLLAWRALNASAVAARRMQDENADLRRQVLTCEAVIKAEAQVLVFWEHGQGLRIVTHSLSTVAGLPGDHSELLRFGRWLDPRSADELKESLDGLFTDGRPFNLILKTTAGAHLEADGRAAGGRAVLRLRDIAGYRRDLVRILEQHRQLARDIQACKALLDALPMPVWLRGAQGRIDWVNGAYVKAVEASTEAEVRERQIELLEQRQRQSIDRALAKGQAFRKRYPLNVAGERKAHDVVAIPLDGATAGAAIDVAEIETAKGELDRQIAAYDRTLDRVSTAVAITSREQKLSFYNDAYAKLWQLDTAWLDASPADGEVLDRLRELGRLPEMIDYRKWKAELLSCYATGREHEDWWHLPDGRILHVVAEQRPDGGVTYLYADETERLALESRYNALISVQRETLDSLKEGVAVFATDGRLKLFNSAFASIWKLSRRTLAETPHIDQLIALARVLHDDQRTWSNISRAVTAFADEREALEGQMIRPDNSVIDFATAPLPDGGTLITFADVTDSKRYERALLERNEALIAADRLKNQFISHVSYELRTPLTNIIGFSELLASPRTGDLNEKQREYLSDLSSSSKTLLAIVDDILDLATIDAGALELKLAPVSAGALIDAAVEGVRDRASRARLTLDIAVADDVKEFTADESRARQVLYNLLSNAVGFSKPGDTIKISCWQDESAVVYSVADQGVGIPKDMQARVFQRFESQSQGSKHRGAGLGLSIARSIVELHGGSLSLESEPGAGTTVTVRFPHHVQLRRPRPVWTPALPESA